MKALERTLKLVLVIASVGIAISLLVSAGSLDGVTLADIFSIYTLMRLGIVIIFGGMAIGLLVIAGESENPLEYILLGCLNIAVATGACIG